MSEEEIKKSEGPVGLIVQFGDEILMMRWFEEQMDETFDSEHVVREVDKDDMFTPCYIASRHREGTRTLKLKATKRYTVVLQDD